MLPHKFLFKCITSLSATNHTKTQPTYSITVPAISNNNLFTRPIPYMASHTIHQPTNNMHHCRSRYNLNKLNFFTYYPSKVCGCCCCSRGSPIFLLLAAVTHILHVIDLADFSKPAAAADVVCVMTSEGVRDLLTYFFRRASGDLWYNGAIVLRCQSG